MKHAAYCGTREIYDDMETAAKSLIANSDVDCVHFVIEDERFPRELPDIIKCHDMSKQTFFKKDGPNMQSQYTYMAMMRIALCHVIPEADRVLSLDADTVAVRDVSNVWDLPIDDCYLSAAEEWDRSRDGLQYCNFGVVLYNLDKMRDGKADECIDVLNTHYFRWVEQDVGNYLCQGRIHSMPHAYNSNYFTDQWAPDPIIKHYAGQARHQWVNNHEPTKYREMSWDEVLALNEARK